MPRISLHATATCLALCLPAAASAQNWDWTGYVYLWGSALGGETTTGQSIDQSFSDVLEKLDGGIMGSVEARNGEWSLLADLLYLNLSEGADAAVGPGIPATADASVKGLVFTGAVGRDLLDRPGTRVVAFGGVRGIDLDTSANISVGGGSQRVSGGPNNWNAIVGLRGTQGLSDRWSLAYYADVGTGQSDLTWQVGATFDYQINNWALSIGYRHLAWDVSNSNGLSQLNFSGPLIGAKFRF